jgi:hypothetical protein
MTVTLIDAIKSLVPGTSFSLVGDAYDGLEWLDSNTSKPTEAELNAEIARLQAEYAAKEYQRDRAAEYPSFADQFDTLYHGGYDAWKAQIDAIKLKYPKP